MNQKLYDLLFKLYQEKKSDLVFVVNGHCIDDRHFRSRAWTKCLCECEIEYRRPYNTRHTFISHFLDQTKDVLKCAALTHGSKSGIKTIYDHYAAVINKIDVTDLF